jgi:hypothetical protein
MSGNPNKQPNHFLYFPGHYRWSAGILGALSSTLYGGPDISEVDRVGRKLRDQLGDDEAWFQAWREEGDTLRTRALAAETRGHALTAASIYLRACQHYQISDHFRQPKNDPAIAVYRKSIAFQAGLPSVGLRGRRRLARRKAQITAHRIDASHVHAEPLNDNGNDIHRR